MSSFHRGRLGLAAKWGDSETFEAEPKFGFSRAVHFEVVREVLSQDHGVELGPSRSGLVPDGVLAKASRILQRVPARGVASGATYRLGWQTPSGVRFRKRV